MRNGTSATAASCPSRRYGGWAAASGATQPARASRRATVMALVEIEAGPFLLTAAVTRDSVEELGLAEGVEATATVKATSVMIERSAS